MAYFKKKLRSSGQLLHHVGLCYAPSDGLLKFSLGNGDEECSQVSRFSVQCETMSSSVVGTTSVNDINIISSSSTMCWG